MPSDIFYANVENYKRGYFEEIQFRDKYQNFDFKFHPKQLKAIEYYTDNVTTSIGYGGAARGGKSALMAMLVLLEAYAYPETRYLMGRRNLQQFWGTTYKTLMRLLHNFEFVDQKDYNHNHSTNEIVFFKPKSEIVIKNLELKPRDVDATEFGSLEITKALLDQTENIELKIIDKIVERSGSHGIVRHGLKGKVLECFNPLKTHVHKRFWLMYKNNIELESIKFVRSLPKDNPSPEAQRWVEDQLKNYRDGLMSEVEYQKQILGNFDYSDDASSLIKYDAIMDYFNNKTIQAGEETYLTIDVARKGKDKTVMRVWKGWLCIARFAMDKSLVTEVVEKARSIQEKYKIKNSNTVADEDGVGGGVVDMLGCMGFVNNSRAEKELIGDEYVTPNYANFKTQCTWHMARKINNREVGEICNSAAIRNLVTEEMEQLIVKDMEKDGKLTMNGKDIITKNIGRSPDDWDSIMMRYSFELQQPIWFV